ncbi:hypothetical protein MJH12_17070 [bacterium]|nr:hypothetical protein [bacterium]
MFKQLSIAFLLTSLSHATGILKVDYVNSTLKSTIPHAINLRINIYQDKDFVSDFVSGLRPLIINITSSCPEKLNGYAETQKIIYPTYPTEFLSTLITNIPLCRIESDTKFTTKVSDPLLGTTIDNLSKTFSKGKFISTKDENTKDVYNELHDM